MCERFTSLHFNSAFRQNQQFATHRTSTPEDARAIVDPALKLMIDAVAHYDGYIMQSTGDGIFELFGAPVVQEDQPLRALYAALRGQGRPQTAVPTMDASVCESHGRLLLALVLLYVLSLLKT